MKYLKFVFDNLLFIPICYLFCIIVYIMCFFGYVFIYLIIIPSLVLFNIIKYIIKIFKIEYELFLIKLNRKIKLTKAQKLYDSKYLKDDV